MWRQGDIFIESTTIPEDARPRPSLILAEGEVTGHAHRVRDSGSATVLSAADHGYLQVSADEAVIEHEEHGAITLPRGSYRFWRQREYTPQAIRIVAD